MDFFIILKNKKKSIPPIGGIDSPAAGRRKKIIYPPYRGDFLLKWVRKNVESIPPIGGGIDPPPPLGGGFIHARSDWPAAGRYQSVGKCYVASQIFFPDACGVTFTIIYKIITLLHVTHHIRGPRHRSSSGASTRRARAPPTFENRIA